MLKEKSSILVRDAQLDDAFKGRMSIVEQKVHTMMAVPLQTKDRIVGLLYVDSPFILREFTKDDPERFRRAQEFRKQVDKQFSFGGSRSDREDAAIPIAWEDRKEAGFTEEELRELAQISGEGPSRDTLMAAARVLRERHLAKRRAQAPAAGGEARA